jgi:hypothetical protein
MLGGEHSDPVLCLCIFKSDDDAGLILFASSPMRRQNCAR